MAGQRRPHATCDGNFGPVLQVAFVNDGGTLLSGYLTGFAVWYGRIELETNDKAARTYQGPEFAPMRMAFLPPEGKTAVLYGPALPLSLWSLDDGKTTLVHNLDVKAAVASVECIAPSADGGRVAATGPDGDVRVWEAASGKELQTFVGHHGTVWCAALSPKGDRLLTGGADGSVRLWDVAGGKELRQFTGHKGAVRCVALSPDGKSAASGGDDRTARVWDLSK